MGGHGRPGRETGGGYCVVWFVCLALMPLLMLVGCAAPTVISTPNSCATLLPVEWKQGVAGADLPTGDTVGDWVSFADATVGKLDQANGRTRDAITIIERCEARDALAVRKATRGFFGRLFGG
jgi:hypothetical protein